MGHKSLLLIGGLVAAALVVGSLGGQEQPAADNAEPVMPELIVREYHIGALLTVPSDWSDSAALMGLGRTGSDSYYSGGGAGGGGGGSLFTSNSNDGGGNPGTERLRSLIERTIHSEEPWESAGGRATLDFYERSGTLLVSQTPKGHAAVAALLARLNTERNRVLVITVKAVELDPTYRDALLDQGPLSARTDAEKKALAAAVKQVYARTSVSGADGQGLFCNAGALQSYMLDLQPIVAENALSFEPTIATIPNGLAVRLQPHLAAEGNAVNLDFVFCYARLKEMRQSEVQGTTGGDRPGTAKAPFDLPTCDADQRAGTITIPLNCPTVIGGSTVSKRLVTGKDEDAGTKIELDYIVTVRMMQP